jgi:hypothetical protein
MRKFINDMNAKQSAKEVPTTLEYRLKTGIAERPSLDPSEAVHVIKQAEKESKYADNKAIATIK